MPFPGFLGPMTPLSASAPGQPSPGLGPSKHLPLVMQNSCHDHWCWAAVAVSVCRFFDPGSTLTQCQVAAGCLNLDCCGDPGPCDIDFDVAPALALSSNLADQPSGVWTFEQVKAAIDAGTPVACHIDWGDQTGHFNALAGYDAGNRDVDVTDPLYGPATLSYDVFTNHYQTRGTWDATYPTRSKPQGVA